MKPMNLKKHLQDPAFRKWAMASSLVLALSASISFNPESKDSRSLQIVSMSSTIDLDEVSSSRNVTVKVQGNEYKLVFTQGEDKTDSKKKVMKASLQRKIAEGKFCADCSIEGVLSGYEKSSEEDMYKKFGDIAGLKKEADLLKQIMELASKLESEKKDKIAAASKKEEDKKPSKSLTAEEREEKRKDLLAKAKEDCEEKENASDTLKCALDSLKKLQTESYLDEKGKSKKLFGNGEKLTEFFKENYAGSLKKAFSAAPDSELFASSGETIEGLLALNTEGMNGVLSKMFANQVVSQLNKESQNIINAYAAQALEPSDTIAIHEYRQASANYNQWLVKSNYLKLSFSNGFDSISEKQDLKALQQDFQTNFERPVGLVVSTNRKAFPTKVLEAMKSSNPLINSTSNQATNELNRLQNPNGQIQNGSSFSRDRFYNGQTPFTNGGQFQPNIGTNQNQLFNPNQQAFPQTQFTNTNSNVLMPPR